ncbi:hypothetical protein INR49_019091 [Caranx melampygus]|nr:hypothetical protein INR49_019091 [Caranx melampygus]
MDSLLDFEECVKDSPEFRLNLDQSETEVSLLESNLDKLFLNGLAELSMYQKKDSIITTCLNQFSQGLQEMVNFHTLAETRREFVRIGEDLEMAVVKNAQVSRHKAGDAERASHLLLATRKCYQHFALDYCLQLNTFKTQQKLSHLSANCAAKRKDLENKHLLVQQRPKDPPSPLCVGDNLLGSPTQKPAALGVALTGPGNQKCCDCGEEEPRWASINLGVTMCIECSGIHRSLGVHLSKVRSLTLDSWEAEQLKLLCVLGNDIMNQIYEARCSQEERVKPMADSPRAEKEMWIKEKYVEKRFVQSNSSDEARCCMEESGLRLYQAAVAGDLVSMAAALAAGAEVNSSIAKEEGRTALIGAAVGVRGPQ